MLGSIFDGLAHDLKISFLNIVWVILIQGPLCFVDVFMGKEGIISWFSKESILFMFFNQSGEKENNASTSFFHPTFLIFSIIALSVLFGCFLIQIIVVHFTETENFSKKIFLSVRNSFLAVFIIFLIPFVFWLFNLFIVHLTEAVGYLQTSGNKDRFSSLTRIIYVIGSYEFVNANDIPNNFSPPTSIENWNLFIQIISVFFYCYVCLQIDFFFVKRLFELFFLFIVSPFVVAIMPLDNGKRLFSWKNLVISRFIISFTVAISFYCFSEIVPRMVFKLETEMSKKDWLFKQVILFLFIIGSSYSIMELPQLVNSFFSGENFMQSTFFQQKTPFLNKAKRGFVSVLEKLKERS